MEWLVKLAWYRLRCSNFGLSMIVLDIVQRSKEPWRTVFCLIGAHIGYFGQWEDTLI